MKLVLISIILSYNCYSFIVIAHKGFHNNHSNTINCPTLNLTDMGSKHSENTIHAVEDSLKMGASMAEIDLRLTKDKKIVVFHDQNLECKTNGIGLVGDKTLSELKKLDAYFNLSFDGGKSFPFRGKGIGKIQELSEYIEKFSNQAFHFNPKDKTKEEVESLVRYLKKMSRDAREKSFFWGEFRQFQYIKNEFPEFGDFLTNGWQTRKCLNFLKLWYKVLNWSNLPGYCLKYNNVTIDMNDFFPFSTDMFSKIFVKYNIQLWGYNVLRPFKLDELKRNGWRGVITPRIGSILINE